MLAAVVVLGAIGATAVASQDQSAQAQYLVELDAVVLDGDDHPVAGLRQEDFQIKEDGHLVDLKTFDAVADTGEGRRISRSIVLLLDDSGVGTGNTLPIQTIARMFVARMGAPDEFSVVRLNSRRDEAFGDRLEALLRISEYRSDATPFFGRETLENALKSLAKVSRTLEAIEQRRKALVCIGLSAVCNIVEPSGRSSLLWRYWVDAIGAMARANASVYSIMPNGLSNRVELASGSIADTTGGEGFRNTNDIGRVIDIIRRDTGNYYLLGYWPPTSSSALSKETHSIEVCARARVASAALSREVVSAATCHRRRGGDSRWRPRPAHQACARAAERAVEPAGRRRRARRNPRAGRRPRSA
jgi:VWFA-related protein